MCIIRTSERESVQAVSSGKKSALEVGWKLSISMSKFRSESLSTGNVI